MSRRDRARQIVPAGTRVPRWKSTGLLAGIGDDPKLADLVSQITPENRYEEIRTGSDLGNEKVDW